MEAIAKLRHRVFQNLCNFFGFCSWEKSNEFPTYPPKNRTDSIMKEVQHQNDYLCTMSRDEWIPRKRSNSGDYIFILIDLESQISIHQEPAIELQFFYLFKTWENSQTKPILVYEYKFSFTQKQHQINNCFNPCCGQLFKVIDTNQYARIYSIVLNYSPCFQSQTISILNLVIYYKSR